MRITILWTEHVDYTSTIEIDEEKLNQYRVEETAGDPSVPASEWEVRQYLDSEDVDWFEQCDITKDFTAVNVREISDVILDKT